MIVGAVGTINFDFRSLYLHFENGCWFTHNHAVKELREDFDELFEISRCIREVYKYKCCIKRMEMYLTIL